MKPDAPVARRADYRVAPVPHAAAAELVRQHHYAAGAGNTSVYAHGLFRGDALVGAALWMPPAAGAAKWMSKYTGGRVPPAAVLTLSRLVVVPGEPQNAAGLLLGGSVRLIARERRFGALVTFADTWRGHTGTVYRATGWVDAGKTKPTPVWLDEAGRLMSRITAYGRRAGRRLTTTSSPAAMRVRGATLKGTFAKHRFVKLLEWP